MAKKGKNILRIHSCGCITQKLAGRSGVNHIYCGSKACPFDEIGEFNKYSEKNKKAKVK